MPPEVKVSRASFDGEPPSPSCSKRGLVLLLLLGLGGLWPTPTAGFREAAVWIDDGNGHTVKEPLSPRESREFSQSLRLTMGLPDHGPRRGPRKGNVAASAPTFMKSIYDTLDELGLPRDGGRDGGLDPAHREALERADTVMSFTSKAPPSSKGPALPPRHAPHRILYFDTTEVSLDHTLLWAELRLHYQPRRPAYMDHHLAERMEGERTLLVFLVTDSEGGELEVARTPLNREGWLPVNVTVPALAWILQPGDNRGLRLAVTEQGHKHEYPLHSVGIATAHDREDLRPILVGFFALPEGVPTKPMTGSRAALSTISPRRDSVLLSRPPRSFPPTFKQPGHSLLSQHGESGCQMRPLHVSFKDLHWDQWVIAPDGYDANFCKGRCDFPMTAEMNATNHAIVQTLIKVLDAVKVGAPAPPAPCCTPNDLATISVLYYDYSSNVVLKKYPEMIVKNCACR